MSRGHVGEEAGTRVIRITEGPAALPVTEDIDDTVVQTIVVYVSGVTLHGTIREIDWKIWTTVHSCS